MDRAFRLCSHLSLAALFVLGGAQSAAAAVSFTTLPQALATVATASISPCAAPSPVDVQASQPRLLGVSKSSAILGGAPSALERMRLQQSAATAPLPTPVSTAHLAAAATVPASQTLCGVSDAGFAASRIVAGTEPPGRRSPDDFLASKRLAIKRTSFDSDWLRVRRQALSHREASRIVGTLGNGDQQSILSSVNGWTNRHIRYAEDKDLYGRPDYWATIRSTLKKRAGDCEDIAIVKMQLLAALGISRDAMFLTVARDLARNADHAMLVVKLDDRYVLLDNATDALLDGSSSHDYRPIYSFGAAGKWLHGYSHS